MLDYVADAAQSVREARYWYAGLVATRDSAIRQCHAEGMTIRKLAEITGMSPARIQQVCDLSNGRDER